MIAALLLFLFSSFTALFLFCFSLSIPLVLQWPRMGVFLNNTSNCWNLILLFLIFVQYCQFYNCRAWACSWKKHKLFQFKVIAALFLFLLFLVSFLGNILLISTISSSLTLRRISFYLILLQVIYLSKSLSIIFYRYLIKRPDRDIYLAWDRGAGRVGPQHQHQHHLPLHTALEDGQVSIYLSICLCI